MPGPGDIAEMESVVIERPSSTGPYGVKGIGEMTANSPIAAIGERDLRRVRRAARGDAVHPGACAARARRRARRHAA